MLPAFFASRFSLFPWPRIRTNLDRIFEDFLDEPCLPLLREGQGEYILVPPVDIQETDDSVIVRTELPGIEAKDISVEADDHTLTIRGERKHQVEEKGSTFHRRERWFGRIQRRIELPVTVDGEKAEAACEHGVLEITLPKRAGARSRNVTVKVKSREEEFSSAGNWS